MVSGDWKESAEGVIRWTDFDHETTLRILQYLYYQDYTNPTPCVLPQSNKEQHDRPDSTNLQALQAESIDEGAIHGEFESPDQTGQVDFYVEQQPDPEPASEIQEKFAKMYRPLTPIEEITASDNDLPNTAETSKIDAYPHEQYSYRECFLAHAHMYRFAHYHSLHNLQETALKRLIPLLQRVNFTAAHADADIAALVELAYSQVPAEKVRPSLRSTLANFVAIHYTSLYEGKVSELFHAGGDFTADVAERLGRRIKAGETLVEGLQAQLDDFDMQQRTYLTSPRSSKKKKYRY